MHFHVWLHTQMQTPQKLSRGPENLINTNIGETFHE